MRLIDADKLLPKLWVCYEENKPIVDAEPTVDAIPIDKPFLKMKYKGYTVYKTEWLKEHIEMEYRVIKGISESKPEAIPIEWIEEYCYENWVEYSSPHDAIRRMLEDWRKENGLLCD